MENRNLELEVKFAHGEGHTALAVSADGRRVLTGGSDGEVRSWSLQAGQEDDDPESYDVGSPIFAIEILVGRKAAQESAS